MRVKIIKCQDSSKWYAGLIGEIFDVDKDYYLEGTPSGIERFKILTGLSWTNAFILKSDCQVIDESKWEFQIPPVSSVNNIVIKMNSIEYDLVPKMLITSTDLKPEKKKEPELNTFQDCWEKVSPEITLDPKGIKHMNLPSIKSAKQIQAAIKLFVIHAALVSDYRYDSKIEHWEVCFHDDIKHGIFPVKVSHGICTQFMFPTEELAQKAIDIDRDIWRCYYGL